MPSAVSDANPIAVSTAARARAAERGPDTAAGGFEALLDIADSAPRPTQASPVLEPSDPPNSKPGETTSRKSSAVTAVQGPRERPVPNEEPSDEQASAEEARADKAVTAAALAQAIAATLPGGTDDAEAEASPESADQPAETTGDSTVTTVVVPAVAAVASPVALAALTLATPEGEPGVPVEAIDGSPRATPAAPGLEIAAAVLAAKGVDPKGQATGLPPKGAADGAADADSASPPPATPASAKATPSLNPVDAASPHKGDAEAAAAQTQAKDESKRASADASKIAADDPAPVSSGIPVDHARSLNTALPALGLYATPLPDPAGAQIAALSPAAIATANPLAPVPLAGVAVEIASRALADANTRFDIRLDPPELGRIDVRLDVDRHGHVMSRLVVERAETLDLLRREAGNIERALENAGLKTDANTMQFSLRDHTAGQRQPHETASANVARLLIRDDQSPDPLPGYRSLNGRPGGLDIRV